jgi:hypothetical protein
MQFDAVMRAEFYKDGLAQGSVFVGAKCICLPLLNLAGFIPKCDGNV